MTTETIMPYEQWLRMMQDQYNSDPIELARSIEQAEAYADARGRASHATLRDLIANDAYAASFQTMGQYRAALLRIMAAGGEDMTSNNKQSEILK